MQTVSGRLEITDAGRKELKSSLDAPGAQELCTSNAARCHSRECCAFDGIRRQPPHGFCTLTSRKLDAFEVADLGSRAFAARLSCASHSVPSPVTAFQELLPDDEGPRKFDATQPCWPRIRRDTDWARRRGGVLSLLFLLNTF